MRGTVAVVVLIVAAAPLAFAANLHPSPVASPSDVIVVVIDTGIDAAHPEFASGQIVAWWDFTKPGHAGSAWMTSPAPYDPHGHGTGAASLVGGATVGAYPGVKLGVAKVYAEATDTLSTGNIVRAIRWAVEVVGADVISMSLGTVLPETGLRTDLDDAVREANDAGVLSVASSGNGVFSLTANVLTEGGYPAASPEALVVGSVPRRGPGTNTGTLVESRYSNSNPDVVAWGNDVCMARAAATTMAAPMSPCASGGRYGVATGTSFATPLVAGWAARVMKAALDAGADASPARVKALVLGTAVDHPLIPYAFEGRGFVNGFTSHPWYTTPGAWTGLPDTVATARGLAASGGAAPAPARDTAAAAAASYALRETSSRTADRSFAWVGLLRDAPVANRLEASAWYARDAEVWSLPLARGDRLQIWVNASQGGLRVNDAEIFLFPPGGRIGHDPALYDAERLAAESRNDDSLRTREAIDHLVRFDGDYALVVQAAWALPGPWGYSLAVLVNGVPVAPAFVADEAHLVARLHELA